MYILGLSCYYHNSAACLLRDGSIIAAAEEERFTRVKNDPNFPHQAIIYCLKTGGIELNDLDAIVYYEKPYLKLERILERFLESAPFGFRSFLFAMPKWIREKLFFKRQFRRDFKKVSPEKLKSPIFFSEHHLSHAAQAFFLSPFENASIVTIDAVGEWETLSIYEAAGTSLRKMASLSYPDSLGLLYSSFTYFLGFEVNEGEYKLMGLAAYGERDSPQFQTFYDKITEILITEYPDGSVRMNPAYFKFEHDLKLIDEKKWETLLKLKRRLPESPMEQAHADLALAIQEVLEYCLIKLVSLSKSICKSNNLCLAGGVALNGTAIGKISMLTLFQNYFVPYAPGDSGAAIGAALAYYHCGLGNPRIINPSIPNPYLGPQYANEEIENILKQENFQYQILTEEDICRLIAGKIASGKIIGWFQGRAEFGPRALGNRSILADPRRQEIQDRINSKVKFREEFRPFAPAILEEEATNHFNGHQNSPFMQYVSTLKEEFRTPYPTDYQFSFSEKKKFNKSIFPAVTHVDYSARVQTVSSESNHRFHRLLSEFKSLTGCPMLLNTSFNKRGEPIVNSPHDALACFLNSEIDILVLNNYCITK